MTAQKKCRLDYHPYVGRYGKYLGKECRWFKDEKCEKKEAKE